MPFVTSTEKNFLFIHIPKSAGSSIYTSLKSYADQRKFGTFISPGPHVQANTLKKEFGKEKYNSYYKFAFIRNPWARLYSYYCFIREHYPPRKKIYDPIWEFKNGTPMNMEFNDWLLHSEFYQRKVNGVKPIPVQRKSQLNWITDDNYDEIIIDFVGTVEKISADWKTICKKINIPYKQIQQKNTTKHKNYKDIYIQESIDFVATHFKREIEMFNYEF